MSRKILVMAHMGRQEAKDAARDSCLQLHEAGLVPVISRDDLEALQEDAVPLAPPQELEDAGLAFDLPVRMVPRLGLSLPELPDPTTSTSEPRNGAGLR